MLESFLPGGMAVVIGSTGGIGSELVRQLESERAFERVLGFSRAGGVELGDEASIVAAAERTKAAGVPVRLVIVATGALHWSGVAPEKTWRQLDAAALAESYAINAIGPVLVAKHFLPLLPRDGKAVFAAISAKVGSISDNHLGGWHGYRAAKAGLNQLIRTAAIELARGRPEAVCVTLHPGTVQTALSAPFRGPGHEGDPADMAAARLLSVIDGLTPERTGQLIDHSGATLPF